MKLRNLLVLGLVISSCAVVTAISSGFSSVGAWAGGISSGSGEVLAGLQQGQWTFKGQAGETLTVGHYKDDVPDGPWVYYYPDGNKEKEGSFALERRTGLWRYYHPSGFNKALGYFHEGREFGQWSFWDAQGQRTQRGFYLEGLQTNLWTSWHPDGSKRSEGWFYEGQSVGLWSFWSSAGLLSQKDYGLPQGVELVQENWASGAARRLGFLKDGKQHSLWSVQHRNAALRLVGSFENGLPEGSWMAFAVSGERLARGAMRGGRPAGDWSIWEGAGERHWNSDGNSPAMPSFGEWSADNMAEFSGVESALASWLPEAASSLEPGSRLVQAKSADKPAVEAELLQALVEPEIPVSAPPLTQKEHAQRPLWAKAYTKLGTDILTLASSYVRRIPAREDGQPSGGDPEGAKRYLGKPLPLTEFFDQEGTPVFLDEMRGKGLVLVVLRGFSGGVCVYCMTQTGALCDAGAFERFKELGARLLVLYPGGKNTLEAFKAGYAALGSAEIPPYGLLYKQDITVAKRMHLEGDKIIPSTFILDPEGIVRFAYLGEHEADRPAVELLYKELEKINRR